MRTIIVGLFFFLLGAGVFWGYGKYPAVISENDRLQKMVDEVPSSAANIEATPTLTPDEAMEEPGTIEGVLGYPSEGIPPLDVYAFDTEDQSVFYKTSTEENQGLFTIENVKPGSYYLVAYLKDSQSNYAGGYSKAVPCGLSVLCTDHSLIAVPVTPGEETGGVEIRDWYAPKGTFPSRPQ